MTKVERLMLFNMSGISPANYRKLLDKYGALANIKQEEIDRLFDKKKFTNKTTILRGVFCPKVNVTSIYLYERLFILLNFCRNM